MSTVLRVADLASEQWGLLTTAQASSVDVTPQALARLANNGTLERIAHGVYRLTGTPPDPLDDLRAAWLALEPGTRAAKRIRSEQPFAVSHRSAAMVHGLGDLDSDEYEFTASVRKQSRRGGTRVHLGTLDRTDWTVLDALPVTTVLRTVADLAQARTDGGHLAAVVRDALVAKQVDESRLAATLRPYSHLYGVRAGDGTALLTRFLQEAGVPDSAQRAAALATRVGTMPDVARLSEQMGSLQSIMAAWAETLRLVSGSETMRSVAGAQAALRDSGQLRALAEVAAHLNESPGLRAMRESTAAMQNSPAMQAVFEALRTQAELTQSPRLRELEATMRTGAADALENPEASADEEESEVAEPTEPTE